MDFRISWASDKFRGIIWVYRLLLQRHLPLHAALTGQPAEGFNVPDAMCRSLPWPWLLFLKPSTGRQNVFSAYEEPKPFSRSSERLDKGFLASRRSPLRTNDEQPCVRIPIRVNARGVPYWGEPLHSQMGNTGTRSTLAPQKIGTLSRVQRTAGIIPPHSLAELGKRIPTGLLNLSEKPTDA